VIIEGLRNDNFSPVKNADGIDSPKSCQKDQLNQAIRWLNAAGVELDISPEGNKTKDFSFEINYRFAMDEEDFINQWNNLKNKPTIELGTIIE
jgi:UDP-N-acetylglucosamine/UDP-N-acetylgalactosamine diphosphorylase